MDEWLRPAGHSSDHDPISVNNHIPHLEAQPLCETVVA